MTLVCLAGLCRRVVRELCGHYHQRIFVFIVTKPLGFILGQQGPVKRSLLGVIEFGY